MKEETKKEAEEILISAAASVLVTLFVAGLAGVVVFVVRTAWVMAG